MSERNVDLATVKSFGKEWSHFDQSRLEDSELSDIFQLYFGIFPWDALPDNAIGFDMGCGSGRWARLVAPRVGHLTCIDASNEALHSAKALLLGTKNVAYVNATANDASLPANSQDFGYSLGVLHHVPDTQEALKATVRPLKAGAPFLLYLYYAFDNRPAWFRSIWRASEIVRRAICAMPDRKKRLSTDIIAALVYWPLARTSKVISSAGLNTTSFPLSAYKDRSFYTMRTDSRDRFGTPLEQRFTKVDIRRMMEVAGLERISFSESEPFWVALGYKTG